jgi:hypothetical protein
VLYNRGDKQINPIQQNREYVAGCCRQSMSREFQSVTELKGLKGNTSPLSKRIGVPFQR